MKKILNSADTFVRDTMEGIEAAYGDRIELLGGDFRVLVSKYPRKKGKVGIVTAGGSGHLPLFLGYVGQGMLDGCAVGEVFASPSSEKMADMIRACDSGAGVLCLYGNYNGDIFNFRMACEDVEFDGIETRQLLGRDDVASSPKDAKDKRRGVAGIVYAYKVAGAAAGAGQGGESEAGERLLDAGIQTPRVSGGHGGEELVVVPGEGGLVGALGQGCAGGLETGNERAQRRGGGVEVVAHAPVHGQGVGDGRGARGPHGAGVGDEVARDQAQQRGLAAAVGADEAGPFAVADGEGDAGQQRLGGEGETEVGEGDRGHAELRSAGG